MKKLAYLFAFCLMALSLNSCDFFRALAGRPGSSYIREKKARIEQVETRKAELRDSIERARLDSVACAERYVADSLYAMDTLKHAGKLRKASSIKNIPANKLDRRCYVVVGAFSNEANARRLMARYRDAGFDSMMFRYRSGLNAVFVAPCNRITDAFESYRAVMRMPFASKETWILVNE